MNRLIEVTVNLHLERGDREALREERRLLLRLAKEFNLIPIERLACCGTGPQEREILRIEMP